jgi:hypothetical protein
MNLLTTPRAPSHHTLSHNLANVYSACVMKYPFWSSVIALINRRIHAVHILSNK